MYQLVCVASVFRRHVLGGRFALSPMPRSEEWFKVDLPDRFSEAIVSQTLARLVPDVEAWLAKNHADLVDDVVVTVYSIETADVPTLDAGGV